MASNLPEAVPVTANAVDAEVPTASVRISTDAAAAAAATYHGEPEKAAEEPEAKEEEGVQYTALELIAKYGAIEQQELRIETMSRKKNEAAQDENFEFGEWWLGGWGVGG